ncbi:hypothetical protein HET69_31990 [Streptomyces sp. CJ_13]|uniref:hypothetical protein n=1 Tax=Streptomyces TaxID=1883 RepID=UPI000F3A9569|nr:MULTISPECIES: hypothetical protein [unclassified Streptomyces]AYV29437.1 hypothetical protein EES41_22250 [Streptomyces sp. ADI95-16]MBT1188474.1 hypothetical protein [Streptomyces sp. CJ_13]
MSFGDPHNPYGSQQGQPGYGYPPQAPQQVPQQAPQGIPPQGYGYPQQQPPQAYPGYPGGGYPAGFPGAPAQMPGLMKTARVLLFVIGGFQLLGALLIIVIGALVAGSENSDVTGMLGGGAAVVGVVLLLFALAPLVLGVRLGKGATPVRVLTAVYGGLGVLGSLANVATVIAAGSSAHDGAAATVPLVGALVGVAIGLTVSGIIFGSMVTGSATAWFNRPRHWTP